jgi:hypothetical protein
VSLSINSAEAKFFGTLCLAFCIVILGTHGFDVICFSGTEANNIHPSRVSDFATFEQSLGFRIDDAVDLSRSM